MIINLLTLLNQLKIYHWQTKSYAQHKAFGDAYDSLDELVDAFVEVFIGKYGSIENTDGYNVKLSDYSEKSVITFIDKMIEFCNVDMIRPLKDSDTDLLNIRDEMLATLNKLKYLLTLK